MVLRNPSTDNMYSRLANKALKPGGRTRDLDVVQSFADDLLKRCRGFDVELSERDLDAIGRLLDAHLRSCEKSSSTMRASEFASDGAKAVEERLKAARTARQKALSSYLKESREREARIQAESNIIGPDGNPVNDRIAQEAVRKDIAPELHPEMTDDISKVMANNLAVMEGREDPGADRPRNRHETIELGLDRFRDPRQRPAAPQKVPTDPKAYQRAQNVPPGCPDIPGAGDQYAAAAKEWRGLA